MARLTVVVEVLAFDLNVLAGNFTLHGLLLGDLLLADADVLGLDGLLADHRTLLTEGDRLVDRLGVVVVDATSNRATLSGLAVDDEALL